jgi:hypothetical protein
MGEIEELREAFPDIEVRELQGGANLYLKLNLITVYFRRKKYAINGVWAKYSYWQDFIPLVNTLVNPPQKVALPNANAVPKTIEQLMDDFNQQPWQVVEKYGVQDCLDHIQKKIDYGQANNLSPSNVAMLNNLLQELRQYL